MQLTYSTSYLANSFGIGDIAAVATVSMGGNLRLVAAPRSANETGAIFLGPSAPVSGQGEVVYPAQLGQGLAWHDTGSSGRLYYIPAFNAPMVVTNFQSNGTPIGARIAIGPAGQPITDATAVQVLEFAGGDWIALAQRSDAELQLYNLSNTGGMTGQVTIQDTDKTYVRGVSDTATLARGADQLLLTISALENGISSYRIGATGAAEWIDSYGAQNGMAVNGLAMVKTAQIAGVDFAILAATNSNSLTVLRVNPMGVFFETDHIFDTRDTRFANLAAFDSFVAQDRLFIVAAGNDSGMTVLELLPDGSLSVVKTFVLEGGAGPSAITAVTAQVMGNSAAIFLVDSGADRVLRYDLNLASLGGRIDAATGQATGTALDERLLGSGSHDNLNGGGGDDFIHDGAGSDTLTGGAGADVFVFDRDGARNTITDFQDGVDRIDLSSWGRIYAAQSLTISATATGATITFGTEVLTLISHNSAPLSAAVLTDLDFIF